MKIFYYISLPLLVCSLAFAQFGDVIEQYVSGSGVVAGDLDLNSNTLKNVESVLYRTPDVVTTAATAITVDASEAITTVDAEGSSGNITITVANAVANKPFLIRVVQGSVARTVAITGAVYPGGVAYVATATNNAVDQIVCYPTSNAAFECSCSLDYK
jgi:hypothetical protein